MIVKKKENHQPKFISMEFNFVFLIGFSHLVPDSEIKVQLIEVKLMMELYYFHVIN